MSAIASLRQKYALKRTPARVGEDARAATAMPAHASNNVKSMFAVREAVKNMEQFVNRKNDNSTSTGWLRDIRCLDGLLCSPLPTRTVVVVGHAGHGKTTLLNSLLRCPILTTGAMGRACTSAVVEIHYDNIPNYRAKVDFLSRSAWLLFLEPIVNEVVETCQRLPSWDDAQSTSTMEDNAAVLVQLFPHLGGLEVYGNVSLETLTNHPSIAELIGSSREFSVESPEEMEDQLRSYLSSRQDGHQHLTWYFVDSAKIYGRFDMLSTGTVLIDLPGYGDSNSVRARKAGEYMKRADTIILVSDIRRVADDANTHRYLKTSIERFVGFDGRAVADDALMMVVTGSDNQIAESEFDFQTDQEREHVRNINTRIEHTRADIEIGNEVLEQIPKDAENDLKMGRDEIAQHVRRQAELLREKLCYLAKRRADRVAVHVQKLYRNTFDEINKGNATAANHISVHVVGSVDYRRLLNPDPMQAGPMVFNEIDQTGIPALQQHIRNVALRERSLKLVSTLTSFDALASEMCQHYQAHQTSNFDTYVVEAKKELERLQLRNRKIMANHVSLITDTIETIIASISEAAEKSAEGSYMVLREFGASTHHNTYRAILRRRGEGKDVDLNDLLSADFSRPNVLKDWNMTLNRTLPAQLGKLTYDLVSQVEHTLNKMVLQAEETLKLADTSDEPSPAKRRKLDIANNTHISQACRSIKFKDDLNTAYRQAYISVKCVQRSFGGTFKYLVQKELGPQYDVMGLEKGKGMVNRMKTYIEGHFQAHSEDVFQAVVERVRKPLSEVQAAVDSAYSEALEKVYRVIRNTMLVERRSTEDAEQMVIKTHLALLDKSRKNASVFANRLREDAEKAGQAIAASSARGQAQ